MNWNVDCTRQPRTGEQNGVNYFFVSRPEFEALQKAGGFIETAEFSGNLYGTSVMAVDHVQAQNKICVMDLEVKGTDLLSWIDSNVLIRRPINQKKRNTCKIHVCCKRSS